MVSLSLDKIIYGSIALTILFLMLSTIIMPYFSTSYRYAQDVCWTNTTANCDYDTTKNATVIPNTSAYVCNYLSSTDWGVNANMCQHIETAGGYRFVNQSMLILVFFLAILGFALMFLPKRR